MPIQCRHNSSDKFDNTQTYQYDANGNLTYVATGRKMKDGHTEDLISERKLLWDDENCLMAISDNGYVSTYRYDDAGNRTVKLSGYGESVFVNGSDTGNVLTQTSRFTAYPNPYMVYNGSRYYKHIYMLEQSESFQKFQLTIRIMTLVKRIVLGIKLPVILSSCNRSSKH